MLDTGRVLALTNQRSIIVPRPHPRLVTRRMLVMEELSGLRLGRRRRHARLPGSTPPAVLRSEVISFLEGALLYGVFHGDLHGGNLFVQPDGRVALLDHGITGRLDEPQRLGFLRLLVGGTTNDVVGQIDALRIPRGTPSRRPHRGRHPRPRARQAGPGHRHALGRRADIADPRPHKTAPLLRRTHAERAHAVREGHALPRWRRCHDGTRDRPVRGDRRHRRLLRTAPWRAHRSRRRRRRTRDAHRPRRRARIDGAWRPTRARSPTGRSSSDASILRQKFEPPKPG